MASANDGEVSLQEATQAGDRLLMLRTLRRYISRQIEGTESGRDMAALSKQFVDVSERIDEIEKSMPDKNRRTALDAARKKRKAKKT